MRNKRSCRVFKLYWTGSSLGAARSVRAGRRMPRTGLTTPEPGQNPHGLADRAGAFLGRGRDSAIVGLHRLAVRLDLVPPEFGGEQPVDEAALFAEWKRYFRLWAGYRPEKVFALKVGGVVLLAGVVALWLGIPTLH